MWIWFYSGNGGDEDTDVLSEQWRLGNRTDPPHSSPMIGCQTRKLNCHLALCCQTSQPWSDVEHDILKATRRKLWRRRLSGVAHIGAKGQAVSDRTVQSKDCSKCLRKCSSNFSGLLREQINKEYCTLDTIQKKNQFIANWTEETEANHYCWSVKKEDQPILFHAT